MSDLILVSPGDNALVGFDFSDSLPPGVTVSSVVHSVPAGLTMGSEANDTTTSTVFVSGFAHAGLYQIKALATLSNGETLDRSRPVRCAAGA
jgi:hypothetical protein